MQEIITSVRVGLLLSKSARVKEENAQKRRDLIILKLQRTLERWQKNEMHKILLNKAPLQEK